MNEQDIAVAFAELRTELKSILALVREIKEGLAADVIELKERVNAIESEIAETKGKLKFMAFGIAPMSFAIGWVLANWKIVFATIVK